MVKRDWGGGAVLNHDGDNGCPFTRGGREKWFLPAQSSTVIVAVVVNRFFLSSVDDYGDDYGSRCPPVIPFSLVFRPLEERR